MVATIVIGRDLIRAQQFWHGLLRTSCYFFTAGSWRLTKRYLPPGAVNKREKEAAGLFPTGNGGQVLATSRSGLSPDLLCSYNGK
jgi:hypothetical protein